jgi:tetratricopeptide (TPR) repeat protein
MSRDGGFTSRSDLPQMTSELETAIALDPGFADSYMLLAFAQAYAGDPAKGLVTMQKAVSLSPRNEKYQFNLAQMYLNNQKVDDAITILQALEKSSNPEVMQRASLTLVQAQQFKASRRADQGADFVPEESADPAIPTGNSSANRDIVQQLPSPAPPKFLKGTILGVDCSSAPAATLTILSGAKTWKMYVMDSKHAVVTGADEFSCSWKKEKVAINYRETGDATGNVVSIEVQ